MPKDESVQSRSMYIAKGFVPWYKDPNGTSHLVLEAVSNQASLQELLDQGALPETLTMRPTDKVHFAPMRSEEEERALQLLLARDTQCLRNEKREETLLNVREWLDKNGLTARTALMNPEVVIYAFRGGPSEAVVRWTLRELEHQESKQKPA